MLVEIPQHPTFLEELQYPKKLAEEMEDERHIPC